MKAQAVVERLSEGKIEAYWPLIERELLLVPFIWDSWWTLESLHHFVITGQMQLWASGTKTAVHNFLFTQVSHYPAQSILQIVFMFGNNLDATIESINASLESYARETGCGLVEATGRKGWEKKLSPLGWKYRASVMQRVVPMELLQ